MSEPTAMRIRANGTPDPDGFFRGLAQAPLFFHNAVAELVDNAIAAKEEGFHIQIDLSQEKGSNYTLTVADSGPGVEFQDLRDRVFRTGATPKVDSPTLNEHGFGLKNVLAKTQQVGGSWELLTRDRDAASKKKFYQVLSPLKYELDVNRRDEQDWPKYGSEDTGTIVRLTLPLDFLKTVGWGRRGRPPSTPSSIMSYLKEHLGVYYRGYLGLEYIGYRAPDGQRSINQIVCSLNGGDISVITPVEPDYNSRTEFKKRTITTSRGTLNIEGEYGLLNTNSETTRKQRLYYYRNTTESQGVDIRVGRRVIATRLITEIWEAARHPSYNAFWGEFRLPAIRGKVPRTLNNKTSIDFNDTFWDELTETLRAEIAQPLKTSRLEKDEEQLRNELYKLLESAKISGELVEKDFGCWSGTGSVIDIYRKSGTHVIIYEVKVGKAHPLDVYQLRMYWDGMIEDGKQPTQGVLVAHEQTTGVSTIMKALSTFDDKNGNKYNFEFKHWSHFGL